MKKTKEISPYLDFTIEEIEDAERDAFVIQMGGEFFDFKGRYTFTKTTAEKFYKELHDGLREMLADENKKDKAQVTSTLLNLRILPFRFH